MLKKNNPTCDYNPTHLPTFNLTRFSTLGNIEVLFENIGNTEMHVCCSVY